MEKEPDEDESKWSLLRQLILIIEEERQKKPDETSKAQERVGPPPDAPL
jgi:hypothetical protein